MAGAAGLVGEPSTRVHELLGRFTFEQKVAQLGSVWLTMDPESGDMAPYQGTFGPTPSDPAEALADGIGQLTRPLGSRPVDPLDGARLLSHVQARLVQGEPGIPAISHEEVLAGLMARDATQAPCPLALGATWDPDLVEEVARAIGRQTRAVGGHQGLAPVVDVVRDPRWGRVEECFGEDPFLVGSMATAYVRGLQGDDLRAGVVATLKHFAGYSGGVGGRNLAPVPVGERDLADVFLLPFEMAVKLGGAAGVMCSYNDIDGEPAAASHRLLTEVLREHWGFDGIVVADYFAVTFLKDMHHVAADLVEAGGLALRAGLDVELPATDAYAHLAEAVDRGLLDEAEIDRAVLRVLAVKEALGLLDEAASGAADPPSGRLVLSTPDDVALVRRAATKGIVLLKDDAGLLPLDGGSGGRLAVIGPNADRPTALLGNYSFANHVADHFPSEDPGRLPASVLEVLADAWEGEVVHAEGCDVTEQDASGFVMAGAAASVADVAVVVVGDRAGHFGRGTVGEGTDTEDLTLPGLQADLVEAILSTGTPTVLVLLNGRPFDLGPLAESAPTIVEAFFPGEQGAEALVDVLLGRADPGGRLPVSTGIPAGAQPLTYLHRSLATGIPPRTATQPQFPFGHGLSYTRFELDRLELSASQMPLDGTVEVSCTVSNVGDRTGSEVVQLYSTDPVSSLARPVRELKGFARVDDLPPGASARVTFSLHGERFAFTGREGRRVVEPGAIELQVGRSSADRPLRATLTLQGDEPRHPGEDLVLVTPVRVERAAG
jgi:beta-xylosidase